MLRKQIGQTSVRTGRRINVDGGRPPVSWETQMWTSCIQSGLGYNASRSKLSMLGTFWTDRCGRWTFSCVLGNILQKKDRKNSARNGPIYMWTSDGWQSESNHIFDKCLMFFIKVSFLTKWQTLCKILSFTNIMGTFSRKRKCRKSGCWKLQYIPQPPFLR